MMRLRAVLCGLLLTGGGGCVSMAQHDEATAEIQRLRLEAAQSSREAAVLRGMIDRMNVDARTREPANIEFMRRYGELAASFADVSKRCSEALVNAPPAGSAPAPAPAPKPAREITDQLFGGRH
jgi:hypothetical protein